MRGRRDKRGQKAGFQPAPATCRIPRGSTFPKPKDKTMRIADNHLNCSFYLYPDAACAGQAESRGGTGFFIGIQVESEAERHYVYPVTCRHVIEQGFCTVRVNLKAGGTALITSDKEQWCCSPENDIAVGKIELTEDHRITLVPAGLFVTNEWLAEHNVGLGDPVYLIGRLLDSEHEPENTPVVRFGHLARSGTVKHWNPTLKTLVQTFFCEVKSVGGFSGSPVFVEIPPFDDRGRGTEYTGVRKGPRLLGVDWGHTRRREPVYEWSQDRVGERDGTRVLDDYYVYRNSGVACVAPAWDILRMLEDPRFRAMPGVGRISP